MRAGWLLGLALASCGGQATAPRLECWSDGVVETADGPRLVVACSRPTEAPSYCQAVDVARWHCNILHTTEQDCDAFPGLC